MKPHTVTSLDGLSLTTTPKLHLTVGHQPNMAKESLNPKADHYKPILEPEVGPRSAPNARARAGNS